jgi:hypothetical protein
MKDDDIKAQLVIAVKALQDIHMGYTNYPPAHEIALKALEQINTDGQWNTESTMEFLERKASLSVAVEALRKIDEPHVYHHREPDDYTQVACFQHVAHEARKAIGDV